MDGIETSVMMMFLAALPDRELLTADRNYSLYAMDANGEIQRVLDEDDNEEQLFGILQAAAMSDNHLYTADEHAGSVCVQKFRLDGLFHDMTVMAVHVVEWENWRVGVYSLVVASSAGLLFKTIKSIPSPPNSMQSYTEIWAFDLSTLEPRTKFGRVDGECTDSVSIVVLEDVNEVYAITGPSRPACTACTCSRTCCSCSWGSRGSTVFQYLLFSRHGIWHLHSSE